MKLKQGTVYSKASLTRDGTFKVWFGGLDDVGEKILEDVRYVSPFGNTQEGWISIPPVGALVLVAHEPDTVKRGDLFRGYYYLGSIMGPIPNTDVQVAEGGGSNQNSSEYVDKDSTGLKSPNGSKAGLVTEEGKGWLPERFKDMYDAKGIIPESLGFTNHRADAVKISDRYNSTKKSENPFQDYSVGIISGNGKRIQAVDSPMVDGIVMTNEHKGKDFFIWSTGNSDNSPFAEGEYHMRTHGPVNMYTLYNRMHLWVEDGLNIDIENKSSGSKSYNGPNPKLGSPGTGGYQASRKDNFGNETTGCINLISRENNVSVSALGSDSVIHIHAPGNQSRVIVDTGGTVDIVAQGKITLQSSTEIELNAPLVDINGSDNVFIDGGTLHLNQPDPAPEL